MRDISTKKQKAEAQKSAVLAEFSAVLAKISTSTAEIEECAQGFSPLVKPNQGKCKKPLKLLSDY